MLITGDASSVCEMGLQPIAYAICRSSGESA